MQKRQHRNFDAAVLYGFEDIRKETMPLREKFLVLM